MPRPRKPENKGLPARWRFVSGAYYYQVPPGQEAAWDDKQTFRLGKTLPEAYKVWAERLATHQKANNIGQLLDRYALEVIPTKAIKTQTGNRWAMPRLRAVFGAMPLTAIKPQHIYQYVDRRSKKQRDEDGKMRGGRVVAHREVELLSHAFTKAVEWGYISAHPFKSEVRLAGEKPRDRYVEDWEIIELLSLPSPQHKGGVKMIQAYTRVKLLTGLAQGDLLRLTMTQLKDDGIHVQRHKTKTRMTIYEWTPELRAAVEYAKSVRPALSPFLFCTRKGAGFIDETNGEAYGFRSIWQRCMDRLLAETKVTQRFTEHDMRAKVGSDAETLEHARALLQHADVRTTQAIYRRKPERVKPRG